MPTRISAANNDKNVIRAKPAVHGIRTGEVFGSPFAMLVRVVFRTILSDALEIVDREMDPENWTVW